MTKPKIQLLSDSVINQIAAGEVIEHPGSVVKELVDNALDAGATDIRIEILAGGLHLIRVTDNGSGMDRESALLSIQRHATSKLHSVDDLHRLLTQGFRGEALPSIASVSQFTMMTRPRDEDEGTLLCLAGGDQLSAASIACRPGTSIEVKQLFFNVPARRKFLKSPAQNAQEVLRMVTRLSLAYPERQFTLLHNQQIAFQAPFPPTGSDPFRERVQTVWGDDFLSQALPVHYEQEGYALHGWVGLPSQHRPNKRDQILILNQRPVTVPLIAAAIREGYGTALPENRYPVFVLQLTIPGERVDINVHPQKKEVRLQYEPFVRSWVMKAMQQALGGISFEPTEAMDFSPPAFSPGSFVDLPDESIPQEMIDWKIDSPAYLAVSYRAEPSPSLSLAAPHFLGSYAQFLLWDGSSLAPLFPTLPGEGITFLDSRGAQRRILFEEYRMRIQTREKGEMQRLLFPLFVKVGSVERILAVSDSLEAIGFLVEKGEENGMRLMGIPAGWNVKEAEIFLTRIAQEEASFEQIHQKEQEEQLARWASQSALSQRNDFSSAEALQLVQRLQRCEHPLFCPRGKQLFAHISKEEVEKKFS